MMAPSTLHRRVAAVLLALTLSLPRNAAFQVPVSIALSPTVDARLTVARAHALDNSEGAGHHDDHATLLLSARECALDDSCGLDKASRLLTRLAADIRSDEDTAVIQALQEKFRDVPVTFAAARPVVRIRDPHVVVHSPATGGLVADTLVRLVLSVAILSCFVILLSTVDSHPASLPLQIGDWMIASR